MSSQHLTRIRSVIVLAMALMLDACANSAYPINQHATITPIPQTAVTRTVETPIAMTQSPVNPPSKPMSTVGPTFVPASPTPESTVTPISTLPAEQAAKFLVEMLKTNGGCELPCWWGIKPGETTYRTVTDFFASRGIPLYSGAPYYDGGDINFNVPHPKRLFDYLVNIRFDAPDGVVRSMKVQSEISNGQASQRFSSDWQRFTWYNVLATYGAPSQVLLNAPPPADRDAPLIYELSLLYQQSGFAITYGGPATYDPHANAIRVCPAFSAVTDIRLTLVPPGSSLSNTISGSLQIDGGIPLEEATGMSMEAFYKNFMDRNMHTCVEQRIQP